MQLPPQIAKLFWGDDLDQLNLEAHQNYITQTVLEKGDQEAVHWLFSTFQPEQIKSLLPQLKLSKKSANFWSIYLT